MAVFLYLRFFGTRDTCFMAIVQCSLMKLAGVFVQICSRKDLEQPVLPYKLESILGNRFWFSTQFRYLIWQFSVLFFFFFFCRFLQNKFLKRIPSYTFKGLKRLKRVYVLRLWFLDLYLAEFRTGQTVHVTPFFPQICKLLFLVWTNRRNANISLCCYVGNATMYE